MGAVRRRHMIGDGDARLGKVEDAHKAVELARRAQLQRLRQLHADGGQRAPLGFAERRTLGDRRGENAFVDTEDNDIFAAVDADAVGAAEHHLIHGGRNLGDVNAGEQQLDQRAELRRRDGLVARGVHQRVQCIHRDIPEADGVRRAVYAEVAHDFGAHTGVLHVAVGKVVVDGGGKVAHRPRMRQRVGKACKRRGKLVLDRVDIGERCGVRHLCRVAVPRHGEVFAVKIAFPAADVPAGDVFFKKVAFLVGETAKSGFDVRRHIRRAEVPNKKGEGGENQPCQGQGCGVGLL